MVSAASLPGGAPLGSDERVIAEGTYSFSPLLFFLRTSVALTDRRVVASAPNVILGIIPAGANTVTYPLNQVASSQVGNSYSVGAVIIGIILILIGLIGIFSGTGALFIVLIVGVLFLLAGIKAGIKITNTGGAETSMNIVPWERAAAQNFVNSLNTVLAERME
jgi:hypothetical protein